MNHPLISIILPVYNREKYIEDSIGSILNQTFKNFELIIVDDGSSDNSVGIVEKINDLRIKIFRNSENRGLSNARNIGIQHSSGKYIAFMDSDDISHPRRLEKQLKVLTEKKDIIVCGSWLKLMDSGSEIKHQKNHNELICQMLINCPLSIGSVLMRSEIFIEENFDENLRFGEDYEFWSRVIWKGRIHNIQESLLYYRTHAQQNSIINIESQHLMDAKIRLRMFQNICYDQEKFDDSLIIKLLTFEKRVAFNEFSLYLSWLKKIVKLNKDQNVFPEKNFNQVIDEIRMKLVFKIFGTRYYNKLSKFSRFKILAQLDLASTFYVLKLKGKERMKFLRR